VPSTIGSISLLDEKTGGRSFSVGDFIGSGSFWMIRLPNGRNDLFVLFLLLISLNPVLCSRVSKLKDLLFLERKLASSELFNLSNVIFRFTLFPRLLPGRSSRSKLKINFPLKPPSLVTVSIRPSPACPSESP